MLLTKNIVQLLLTNFFAKDDSSYPSAERVMNSIKAVLESDETTPAIQSSIMEKLLQLMGLSDSDHLSGYNWLIANYNSRLNNHPFNS